MPGARHPGGSIQWRASTSLKDSFLDSAKSVGRARSIARNPALPRAWRRGVGPPAVRILFVITRADSFGGAHVHVRDLGERLLRLGHDVQVVTGSRGPFSAMLERVGIPTVECPPLQRAILPVRDARAVAALRQLIAAFQPDLVSTHSSKAGIIGRLACAAGGPPCLFTAHGWAFTPGVPNPQRSLYRLIERSLAPLAARIICVSEHDRGVAIGAGIRPSRLVTIHNGMPDIPPTLRSDPGRGDPVRIVMVARFASQKDHPTLLRALAAVEGAQLDLVGEGPSIEATRALARSLGIEHRVAFLGHREDIAQILSRSHLFALISHWEGFPRSTLEAMRAGLPVIVSDAGGSAEAVEEGTTGYVVPPGDLVAARDRLRRLVASPRLRQEFGAAGRQRYETEFTFERMFQRTFNVYRSLVPALRDENSGGHPPVSKPEAAEATT